MVAVVVVDYFNDFRLFGMKVHYYMYEKHALLERTTKISMWYSLPWHGWPMPRMEWYGNFLQITYMYLYNICQRLFNVTHYPT